jgi:hypothetical protein
MIGWEARKLDPQDPVGTLLADRVIISTEPPDDIKAPASVFKPGADHLTR